MTEIRRQEANKSMMILLVSGGLCVLFGLFIYSNRFGFAEFFLMQVVLLVLLSLASLYVVSLAGALVAAIFIVRKKLREHQESSPYGY